MPSDDPDKIYIKKFKINSLLNDLFTILTQNKPDDPIEYCLQHFESKLDPEKKAARVERKASVDGEISNKSAIDNMSALNILSQLNIMNKIDKIIVKNNKELTPEQELEKEMIYYRSKGNDDEEEEASSKKTASFKTDLKNREDALKHKQELRAMVEQQVANAQKEQDAFPEEAVTTKREALNEEEIVAAPSDDEENELLMGELHTARKFYQESLKKKRKEQVASTKIRPPSKAIVESMLLKLAMTPSPLAPTSAAQQEFVCTVCKRKQQSNAEDNLAVKNIPPLNIPEEVDEAGAVTAQLQPKNIFDFFKQSIRESANVNPEQLPVKRADETYRKSDNFDDDNIESASQVSGPRPIDAYEAPTSRSAKGGEIDAKPGTKDAGILGWLMEKKKYDAQADNAAASTVESPKSFIKATEIKKSSEGGSYTSRTLVSSRGGSKDRPASAASKTSRVSGGSGGLRPATSNAANKAPVERKQSEESQQKWIHKESSDDD